MQAVYEHPNGDGYGLVYQPPGRPYHLFPTTVAVVQGTIPSKQGHAAVSYDLFDVKQYQAETLKEYINRFGAQVVKVGTSEEPMIVYAFAKGVCPGPFGESIIRNRPRTSGGGTYRF